MSLLNSLSIALKGLASHKLRSLLTILGIVIGVSAVIALMSIGTGAQAAITSRFEKMGTNLIFVRPGAVTEKGVRSALGSAATLTLEDAEAIADPANCPSVLMVAPEVFGFGQVVAGGENVNTRIVGVTPEYQYVRNFPVAEGEFISQRHLTARSMVCVLGSEVAETLFGGTSPIGQKVKINRRPFQVIGVLESKGGTVFASQDDAVLIPITTALYRLMRQRTARGGSRVQNINVQVVSAEEMEAAKEQITELLRERHHIVAEDDFYLLSQKDIIGALTETTKTLTLFLGAIAGISLLVGGIGIMNIMLVSVTERTREIGIRKAVGAKRRDILLQFLIEAITLSLSGGVVGILLGWGFAHLIPMFFGGGKLQTMVSPGIVALAFSVAAVTGLFFGTYPAFRAAQLNPIDALRYE